MAHMQYMPGDQRLVDQIVYELKSKGIFDQFRKECIADVDTRPAYQNLRQRVETSVSGFLSRQNWKSDLNKNQLREKLRKHIIDGNYLEQGVERIVDQVVNPKVASVFIPQVEDLVYNYFGITRHKSTTNTDTTNGNLPDETNDLLPTDLEAVSPGSVKSHNDDMRVDDTAEIELSAETDETKMDVDGEDIKKSLEYNNDNLPLYKSLTSLEKIELPQETQLSGISDLTLHDHDSIDNSAIPLPAEEIKPENIPPPVNSPPEIDLDKIELPKALSIAEISINIPLPDEMPPHDFKDEGDEYSFKPLSDDDDSSSDSSLIRNMSPITPIRNFNTENSCDAQQGYENSNSPKIENKKEPSVPISTFRFTIESKDSESSGDNSTKCFKQKDAEQSSSYKHNNQPSLTTYSTPLLQSYEDSSNSNNLQIDYESDNSKINILSKIQESDHDSKNLLELKADETKSSLKTSHSSRDRHRDRSSSKVRSSDTKHSSSKDRKDSKHDKKTSKDDGIKSKSSHKDNCKETNEKKDSRDSSKQRSSSTNKSSSSKDTKTQRSSSSSHRQSSTSSKQSDDKKVSNHKDKNEKHSDSKNSKDVKSTKESSRHSTSHRTDKERKSSRSRSKPSDEKDNKKDKKSTDDHYSLSGRGSHTRRSTDRDSNDGNSSSSKSSNINSSSKPSDTKESKSSSKSDNTSSNSDTTGQSDAVDQVNNNDFSESDTQMPQTKPAVRVDGHLETPVSEPSYLPPNQDNSTKKPKIAENFEEARQLMKMRRYLEAEQRRKNQDAALLLEFQQNVRPNLSQVYSSIPGPELEFVCTTTYPEFSHLSTVNFNVNDSYVASTEQASVEYVMENVSNEAIEDNVNNANVVSDQDISQRNVDNIEGNAHKTFDIESTMQAIHGDGGVVHNDLTSGGSELRVELQQVDINESKNMTRFYEVTVIAEQLSEGEELQVENSFKQKQTETTDINDVTTEQTETTGINDVLTEQIETKDINNVTIKQTETTETNKTTEQIETTDINKITTKQIKTIDANDGTNKKTDINKETTELIEATNSEKVSTEQIETTEIKKETIKEIETTDINKITAEHIENESDGALEEKFTHFSETETKEAEKERNRYTKLYNTFTDKANKKELYLIGCSTYEENIFRQVSGNNYEIVSIQRNGHSKLTKQHSNHVKDVKVSLTKEIALPIKKTDRENANVTPHTNSAYQSPVFSPIKADCYFELKEYKAKIEAMVNTTSRQQIMEIILGGAVSDASPSKMPKIDICNDSVIESDRVPEVGAKRKLNDSLGQDNNKNILSPNKIRKVSDSEQISSTTEDAAVKINRKRVVPRSKYLGKARRLGLSKPKKVALPNSPSSDKSVENYAQNNADTVDTNVNGKVKTSPRKQQRYSTSDLYKPKLHYLSRRNIS